MTLSKKNMLIIIAILIITILPLIIKSNADFAGADGAAEGVIQEMNSNYKPWFSSLWKPPSGEIESLLFALQAALGAGVLGYYIGYKRAVGKKVERNKDC
ncbi:energy-coupling factor ABC transporter substrate-binding protein [Halanaerobacter jeridensis]|uniref:Cobalt transport protein CbiN n=1 Tax=Halanaerobacter jeridensis TaxID=706427 RepID=A0A938XSX4_9FIRM|nr:energy-coupling factor ABC transporter substrate-binding protein [Halanaerobacter jeridensis]MBM7557131.1 cobalt/nickel transport protein [Halanaerobacter jeridensis]